MKRICAVVIIAFFTSVTAFAQSAEQDIRKLLNEFRAAGKTLDKAVYARILADDVLWVNDQGGLHTKADRIALLKSPLEIIPREVDIKVYGDSASAVELLEFPEGLKRRLLYVFARQNKEWKIVRVAAVRLASAK